MGNLLRYGRAQDSSTLDPQATSSGEDAKVTGQIYDRLIHFEPGESTLVEGLAEEFSLEGTTVSLTIRQDAQFHNGDDVTAEDFVATYRRFHDEDYEHYIGADNVSFYGAYVFGSVESIEATAESELEIELESRYAPYLRTLAMFAAAVFPKSEIENDHDFAEDPIGSGPFVFDEWSKSDQQIRLTANEDYWGQKASVGELVFEAVTENSTRAQSLDSRELDIIDGIGSGQANTIENSENASLESKPGMNVGYLALNMERVEAFRDRRVRRAINHAINVEGIIESIYRGNATASAQAIPPTVMGYNEDLDPYEYDPETAQDLLDDAGYGDGLEFELATMTTARPYIASPVQTAETVRSNLADVGIDVEINEQSSFDAYLEYTDTGQHDAAFAGWITDNGDPNNFYEPLLDPGVDPDEIPEGQNWISRDVEGVNDGNNSAWANTEFMELVDEAQQTYDEEERAELYREIGQLTRDEAPWAFMTYTDELRGVSERVNGYIVEVIGGPFLNHVELDE
ncbi:peptide ABC transporter substrate-binding protein (plasmid) [Halostagnicola larsenii XH-48]|uniref:Peptide ABC transporter substrate-binding protein n=1 Tax=Halostagnicola larsenii XH-48 TaxID=797299 RepID=W0JTC0_9EURY|nr:peptide ABC transporter substrate-binding protein [Halostagnicola larsenii XH-48]